jgi:hypothetical protein
VASISTIIHQAITLKTPRGTTRSDSMLGELSVRRSSVDMHGTIVPVFWRSKSRLRLKIFSREESAKGKGKLRTPNFTKLYSPLTGH